MPKINRENFKKLIEVYSGDPEMLNTVFSVISKFEDYHKAIFDMEMKIALYSGMWTSEEYKEEYSSLDNYRTVCHNGVIAGVKILNRMAESKGVGVVFDGVVSEEKPYRRILADAVFEFVNEIIDNRI